MNTSEPLCDLEMIKAEYRVNNPKGREPNHSFRIDVKAYGQKSQFDVPEKEGEVFAAELEAVAAIIRSRVIRARIIGEESS
jgi:hypothetical protein